MSTSQNASSSPTIPVSVGELVDKITILMIKSEKIEDPEKVANVRKELAALEKVCNHQGYDLSHSIVTELKDVNQILWTIEDKIREHERRSDFDSVFIELARSVYRTNDRRAELKREINQLFGSELVEEKSYKPY